MLSKNKLCRFSDEDEAMLKIIVEKHSESKDESKAIRHAIAFFAGNLLRKEYEKSPLREEMTLDEYVNFMAYKKQKEM